MSKIIILASFIGSGHKKAAEAIQNGIKDVDKNADVEIINFFEFAHPSIAKAISALYFKLLESDPGRWDYIYDPGEGKARVAEMLGLNGLVKGIKVKRVLDYAFGGEVEREIKKVVDGQPGEIDLGMKELLVMVGAKPDIADKIYEEQTDKIRFPYSLIEEQLRLMKKMGEYLVWRLQELLSAKKPDVVVCTQVLPCMFMAKLKEKKRTDIPLVAVITDFGVHSFWIKKEVNVFIVPNKEVSEVLIRNSMPENSIKDFGIPIEKKFSLQKDIGFLKKKLGLKEDVFTVLIMSGGLGFGVDLVDTFEKWEEKKPDIQIIVVCGENDELKFEMERIQQLMTVPIKVFGFAENVDEMMLASDVIITKPGGLTIAEAMVCNLPMILVSIIQGQEDNNLKFLLENGMAIDAGKGEKIVSIIANLMQNRELLLDMKVKLKKFSRPNASSEISKLILSMTNN